MHIRLTGLDGGDTRLTPAFLAMACIARHEAATRSGVSTPAHTVIHDGGRYYIVRETPAEILALLAAVGSDPSRPASIEEERLAMGWVQQVLHQCGRPPRIEACRHGYQPAPEGAGEFGLYAFCGDMPVWVRWLVPVEAPND